MTSDMNQQVGGGGMISPTPAHTPGQWVEFQYRGTLYKVRVSGRPQENYAMPRLDLSRSNGVFVNGARSIYMEDMAAVSGEIKRIARSYLFDRLPVSARAAIAAAKAVAS